MLKHSDKLDGGDEQLYIIPKDRAKNYIQDMLGALCRVADQSGQKELLELLHLAQKAAQAMPEE